MPTPTTERKKDLVKQIKKQAEDFRVAIRNARRDAIEIVKKQEKDKIITQDDVRKFEQDIQKLTDAQIKKLEDILINKEKEILEVVSVFSLERTDQPIGRLIENFESKST